MINGIININKEAGFTSHDVVAKLRGILKQKKIGHTGTLDPDATGVLPVCLGNGTKLCELLTDKTKEYIAEIVLGTTTDTEDLSGAVLSQKEFVKEKEQIKKVIESFIGEYNQIPPMYSAIKVNGKKLYELAREGQVIERKPRSVSIYSIQIIEWDLPKVKIIVQCSKGTYIRSLCRDIGNELQCGACMGKLIRSRSGDFVLENSYKLSEIEKFVENKQILKYVTPVDDFFKAYPKVVVYGTNEFLVKNGNKFQLEGGCYKEKVRVYLEDNTFVGVYEYNNENGLYIPFKMFLNGV